MHSYVSSAKSTCGSPAMGVPFPRPPRRGAVGARGDGVQRRTERPAVPGARPIRDHDTPLTLGRHHHRDCTVREIGMDRSLVTGVRHAATVWT
ncbi:hypothetical protein Xph01_18450 [Micromonospora phaseoli]|nr:hypothetical protein Xph01_18450 [Micromonospora phaseoli]